MKSYAEVSKSVGFEGFSTFPSKEEVQQLLWNLTFRPSLEDYKEALSLYRFLPEAWNHRQPEIVYTINEALLIGEKSLFAKPDAKENFTYTFWQWLSQPYKALRSLINEIPEGIRT